ncbi:MAG: HEAT repeat domain-containing protein [Acidobacteria bacterium]|nr:HEAT repeat domain-containing protein [Acidobacteriota bacterium]
MSCERFREQIPECLAGRLDPAARERLVEHLESCAGCRTEVAELNAVWRAMENLKTKPEDAPDPAAKARFLAAIEGYKAGMGVSAEQQQTRRVLWFPRRPVWQAAMAAGLLLAGIFAGRYVAAPRQEAPELTQLRSQVESLRQLVALTMLQQQSPGARLRGVSYSEQMAEPDPQVEQALLYAVNHDTNVNVRLSAVDALQKFTGNPEVLRAMVDAIGVQDSPLVQVALVDLLVQVHARGAAPAMARLAQDARVDEAVRQRAAWAMGKLGGAQ